MIKLQEEKSEDPQTSYKLRTEQLEDNLTVITLDQAYQNSKGSNFFYTIGVFIIISSYSMAGILPYSIPFLIKEPELLCRMDYDSSWESCSKSEACDGTYTEYKVDHNDHESLTNWRTSMDLI